jgi:geranylgeranyl diphosphate synthase type II
MVTAASAFEAFAATVRHRIEGALATYCEFEAGCPPRLREAIRYSLLAPGKRLRPLLCLMACDVCGGQIDRALPAACAVEMIHAYSLIHDDLPAMDDDDLRRGRPTCHKVFGEALAILAGDALQARAFEILAGEIQPPDIAARCCAELAHAAGAACLVGGQADDLGEQFRGGDLETLTNIHARKTAAVLSVSLRLGALCAAATGEELRALDAYGKAVGLAFQITDDLLDVRGEATFVGKRLGKDREQGKLTFPGLLGVEESFRQARGCVERAIAALAPLGEKAEHLAALATYILERDR